MEAPTDAGPRLPPDAPRPRGPRLLRRRPDDGPIAGVCSGLAEYFNVDPIIVRIAAVVLLFSGPGAFAYVLAWIFVPAADGPARHGTPQGRIDRRDRGTQIFGILLLALAISVLWGDWWSPARSWLFPLGLMALGAWLLLRQDSDDEKGGDVDAPDSATMTAWVAPSYGPTSPSGSVAGNATNALSAPTATPIADAPDGHAPDGVAPEGDAPEVGAASGPGAPWDVPPHAYAPEPPASHRHRRMLGPIAFGALLVWAGLAFLIGATVETGLAGALLIVGVGFVLGSFMGGSRVLILPALVVGGALAVTAVVDIPLSGPIGRQEWAPQSVAEIEDLYDVSMGEGELDLTAISMPVGDELQVEASVGIGHLVVLVPSDASLEVATDVGTGESDVLGIRQDGVGVTTNRQIAGTAGGGTIVLDLSVGLGEIEVRRAGSAVRPLG